MDNPEEGDVFKLASLENLNSLPYLAAVIDDCILQRYSLNESVYPTLLSKQKMVEFVSM